MENSKDVWTNKGSYKQQYLSSEEMPLLVTVPEAARLLSIGLTFAWAMVHKGEIPTVRLGKRVLVPRSALEQLASVETFKESSNSKEGKR